MINEIHILIEFALLSGATAIVKLRDRRMLRERKDAINGAVTAEGERVRTEVLAQAGLDLSNKLEEVGREHQITLAKAVTAEGERVRTEVLAQAGLDLSNKLEEVGREHRLELTKVENRLLHLLEKRDADQKAAIEFAERFGYEKGQNDFFKKDLRLVYWLELEKNTKLLPLERNSTVRLVMQVVCGNDLPIGGPIVRQIIKTNVKLTTLDDVKNFVGGILTLAHPAANLLRAAS
jgi:hypothetical protein